MAGRSEHTLRRSLRDRRRNRTRKPLTAWGKEVGGLQAGIGFPAGQKRVYRHGETSRSSSGYATR